LSIIGNQFAIDPQIASIIDPMKAQ
jgi:hypothetical protein